MLASQTIFLGALYTKKKKKNFFMGHMSKIYLGVFQNFCPLQQKTAISIGVLCQPTSVAHGPFYYGCQKEFLKCYQQGLCIRRDRD